MNQDFEQFRTSLMVYLKPPLCYGHYSRTLIVIAGEEGAWVWWQPVLRSWVSGNNFSGSVNLV